MNILIIDREKIKKNLSLTRVKANGASLIGVLSADAFGFGTVEMARIYRDEGVSRFAVDEPAQGALLRRSGFPNEEILVLHSTTNPSGIECMLENGLIATVASTEAAQALCGLAERRRTVAVAHILINTGACGAGFLPHEYDKISSLYQYMNALAVSGLYTHLASARGKKFVAQQLAHFHALLTRMRGAGLDTGLLHAADSATLFSQDIARLDAVRVDLSPIGCLPGRTGLARVGVVQSYLEEIVWLPRGASVGFKKPARLRRPKRVGFIPVGLSDGFGVQETMLSTKGFFHRQPRPVVYAGRVKLNVLGDIGLTQTLVDLTPHKLMLGDNVTMDVSPLFAPRLGKKYL